jgi:hypothetical protein
MMKTMFGCAPWARLARPNPPPASAKDAAPAWMNRRRPIVVGTCVMESSRFVDSV